MKKMMTNMKTLVALLMAGAAVTSCSSDNEMDSPKAPAGKTYTMTVQATKGGDATTRALADGGDGTLTATWATTENVYVKKDDTWATGTLTPQTAGASTTLKGTLSGVTFAADDVLTLQFPKSGDITYAGQNGTLADIAANFDWATATIEVASVEGGNITPKAGASFAHQQAVVKFTLQDKGNSNAAISPSALTINDGTSDIVTLTSIPAETYTTNGAGVLYVALPAVDSKPITLTATVGSDTYTLTTSSSKSFANGSFYRVTAKMAEAEVAGEYFTSKSDGTKVVFSPGNLQYQASTDTWRFAEHQYDYVGDGGTTGGNVTGSNNTLISSTYAGWIDLFGWGTSNKTFASGYGPHYQPWSTSMEYANYGPTGTSNGLYGAFANGDWGVNMTGTYTWRTLTGGSGGEWEYIFSTRTSGATVNGTSDARYTQATINTDGTPVNGIILFPDGCNINSSSATSWGNINSASTWDNATKCTTSQWTALEAKGCVFLPAAGYRDATTVGLVGSGLVGSYGHYWSSSPHASNGLYAHIVRIYSNFVAPTDFGNRCSGFSVRLVREVPSN